MSGTFSLQSLTPDPTLMNQASSSQSSGESNDSSATQELMDSFSDTLSNKLNQVESLQNTAQTKMQKFAAGEIDDVHDVSISMQKAQMGLDIASAVRRKVLQGFDELQQMG